MLLREGFTVLVKLPFAHLDNHHLGSDSFLKRCFVLASYLSEEFSHYGRAFKVNRVHCGWSNSVLKTRIRDEEERKLKVLRNV